MDLSKLSTDDLIALKAGDLSKVSTAGLQSLRSQVFQDNLKKTNPGEYDPESPEFQAKYGATSGMSTADKFFAGAGKAFVDLGRGAGQFLGVVNRDDVAKSRQLDKPLMETGAAKAGNITGNVAAMLPAAFIPGAATIPGAALIGGVSGLLAPSTSTSETLTNGALGGVLGVGGTLLGRGVGALYQGGKALIEPFTKAGQERIAARTLQEFASDPAKAAASLRGAQELVPGSVPTMAQGSGDAGLSQLERTLLNNPESGARLAEQYAAQRAARLAAVEGVAGTPAAREAAVQARAQAAAPLYEQFNSRSYPIDSQLGELLQRPAIQQAMQRAERIAANEGRSAATSEMGPASISGRTLQDINMGVGDLLGDISSGIGATERRAIMGAKGQLLDKLEQMNPAYQQANAKFAELSKPINTMDVAQSLLEKIQPALARYGASTKEQASAYARALEAAKDTVKNQTGINKPIEQVIDEKAMDILNNVAKDLGRKVGAEEMGKAVGSNTAQNLAAQNLLRRVLGPTGLPQSWSESSALQAFLSPYTGLSKLAGSEQRVLDRLTQAALDPADAAGLLSAAARPSSGGLLGQTVAPTIAPLAGAGLLSYRAQ